MDNYQIADAFSLLSKLMDIHGENSFKSKSYASAAFAIEKYPQQLNKMTPEQIAGIKGIGASSAGKITEILKTGRFLALEKIIFDTPPGVVEMLHIKGIGPKKINVIWKEMGIESIGELLYACKENRLKLYKGFGEKTQQNIIDTIAFYLKSKDSHLFASAELIASEINMLLQMVFGEKSLQLSGKFKRELEILDYLEYVVDIPVDQAEEKLKSVNGIELREKTSNYLHLHSALGIGIRIYCTTKEDLWETAILEASSPEFRDAFLKKYPKGSIKEVNSEASFFEQAGLPLIPAYLRENPMILEKAETGNMPVVITEKDILGLVHCHSTWSDGGNSIEELAIAARDRGMQYLAISDHSKSAFYAQGLSEDRIRQQHQEINKLNEKLAPFKIFRSIECDILNDGQLDYSDKILSTFDLVIASVHSNLKMPEEKAMPRLLKAIENPYTTILGHMTGRLLLSRSGYPIDHHKIIDACAANGVAIELNANPNRLDIDWRQISYALEKSVLISINPDAHSIGGINDIRYGVLQARKAMLTKEMNLSSYSLTEFENYLLQRKNLKGI